GRAGVKPVGRQTAVAPAAARASRWEATAAGVVNSKTASVEPTRSRVNAAPPGFSEEPSDHTIVWPRCSAKASISRPILPFPTMPKRICPFAVIPSAARDLLLARSYDGADSSRFALGMTREIALPKELLVQPPHPILNILLLYHAPHL